MTEADRIYQFASEYTRFPGGRLRKHGPYSGEAFREDVLWPLIKQSEILHINLTNVQGFGSSFLDESFGEIGKRMGLAECKKHLEFISEDDPSLVDLIWMKIKKAAQS